MAQHRDPLFDDWISLPEAKRIKLVERSYEILREVANKQLQLLDEFEQSRSKRKTEAHFYFFNILRSFWRDADFALWLGKSQYAFYATYPVRTMMEKMLKLLWFTNQEPEERDLIAKKELLRNCLDLYNAEKHYGRSGEEYERIYNTIDRDAFPNIGTVKRRDLKAFPSNEELCKQSKLVDGEKLYHTYRWLSGLPHGDLFSISRIRGQQEQTREYQSVIMLAVRSRFAHFEQ
jgi:hypothetical protein